MSVNFSPISLLQVEGKECLICLSEFQQESDVIAHLAATNIYHQFHRHCISQAFKTKPECPVCRLKVSNADSYVQKNQTSLPAELPEQLFSPQSLGELLLEAVRTNDQQEISFLLSQPIHINQEHINQAFNLAAANNNSEISTLLINHRDRQENLDIRTASLVFLAFNFIGLYLSYVPSPRDT